jgi:uncharacterized protein (TIGR03435 family)
VASGIDTAEMAKRLARGLNAIVRDETGLKGKYDIDLAWTNQEPRPAPDGAAPDPNELPSLESAVRQKLGLQLTATKAQVDVLVVDQAKKPVAD